MSKSNKHTFYCIHSFNAFLEKHKDSIIESWTSDGFLGFVGYITVQKED